METRDRNDKPPDCIVEREPMWDGNPREQIPVADFLQVEREPMWDGNDFRENVLDVKVLLSENQCGMET